MRYSHAYGQIIIPKVINYYYSERTLFQKPDIILNVTGKLTLTLVPNLIC